MTGTEEPIETLRNMQNRDGLTDQEKAALFELQELLEFIQWFENLPPARQRELYLKTVQVVLFEDRQNLM